MTGRHRWWGLVGAVLVAVGGWTAGAVPGPAPADRAAALWGDGAGFRLGLLAYLAGLGLLAWAWWRVGAALPERSGEGRDGAGRRHRWLLVTGALWALPLLLTAPLASRDLYAYACQGAAWLDGYDPYRTGAAAAGCPWLASVPPIWHETTAPYGPVAVFGSAAAVALARVLATDPSTGLLLSLAGLRLTAVAGVVLAAVALPRLARACGVDPDRAGWLGLVTPLVGVHAVAGGHHDAMLAGLLLAGLAAAAAVAGGGPVGGDPADPAGVGGGPAAAGAAGGGRIGPAGWSLLAGALLGLAVAVKVTASAAVPFGVLLAARRGYRTAALLVVGAGGAFAAVSVAGGLGFGWIRALTGTGSVTQWSSPPSAVGMTLGYAARALGAPELYQPAVTAARVAGFAALVVVAVVAFAQAWRRVADTRAVVHRAGVVLAAVVLLAPVLYPWYAVAALAVLAASVTGHRVRRWLAVATLALTGLTLPSGLGVPALTKFPGAPLVTLLLVLAGWWWLRRARPGRPAVQVAGE